VSLAEAVLHADLDGDALRVGRKAARTHARRDACRDVRCCARQAALDLYPDARCLWRRLDLTSDVCKQLCREAVLDPVDWLISHLHDFEKNELLDALGHHQARLCVLPGLEQDAHSLVKRLGFVALDAGNVDGVAFVFDGTIRGFLLERIGHALHRCVLRLPAAVCVCIAGAVFNETFFTVAERVGGNSRQGRGGRNEEKGWGHG